MANFYIEENIGHDFTGIGSRELPFKTISHAQTIAKVNDTLIILNRHFDVFKIFINKSITMQSIGFTNFTNLYRLFLLQNEIFIFFTSIKFNNTTFRSTTYQSTIHFRECKLIDCTYNMRYEYSVNEQFYRCYIENSIFNINEIVSFNISLSKTTFNNASYNNGKSELNISITDTLLIDSKIHGRILKLENCCFSGAVHIEHYNTETASWELYTSLESFKTAYPDKVIKSFYKPFDELGLNNDFTPNATSCLNLNSKDGTQAIGCYETASFYNLYEIFNTCENNNFLLSSDNKLIIFDTTQVANLKTPEYEFTTETINQLQFMFSALFENKYQNVDFSIEWRDADNTNNGTHILSNHQALGFINEGINFNDYSGSIFVKFQFIILPTL